MLKTPYRAAHDENRMTHEGDVAAARARFFALRSNNLRLLLSHRYEWMNEFIHPGDRGMEVGCGTGISKEFIRCKDYLLTDFSDAPWLDVKHVDAMATPFKDAEFDFVVSSNMVHHVPYPRRFFREMSRILKPGGHLLIQEINASLLMRALLRMMRHEGYSFEPDVFDEDLVCTDPDDLWSANCGIPNLLFDDRERFQREVREFSIVRSSFSEGLSFINSGGVIARTVFVPLPVWLLQLLKHLDDAVIAISPQTFALQRQVALKRATDDRGASV